MERKKRLFVLARKLVHDQLLKNNCIDKTYIDQVSDFSTACVLSGVTRAVKIFMNASGELEDLKKNMVNSILDIYKEDSGVVLSDDYDGDLLYDCLRAIKTAIYSFPFKNASS